VSIERWNEIFPPKGKKEPIVHMCEFCKGETMFVLKDCMGSGHRICGRCWDAIIAQVLNKDEDMRPEEGRLDGTEYQA
jgi:predicted PP-loop superfamily ATPase